MMFWELTLSLIAIFVSQITSIDITFHNVEIRPCNLFQYCKKITIVEGERIRDFIPRNCSAIDIGEQNIPILYNNSFGDMATVRTLNLNKNSISEIRPGVFTGSSMLERIDLQHNNIKEVKAGVFNNLNLIGLSLSFNSVTKIDSSAFDNMPSLDMILLNHNKISTWDSNWFRNCPKLNKISVIDNEIKYLPSKGFAGLLDDSMGSQEHLDSIREVVTIVVSDNQISSIEKDFLDGIHTNYFTFENNSIECFEDSDFQVLTEHFNVTSFVDNLMDCDCIYRLKKICDENNKHITVSDHDLIESKCSNETVKLILTKILKLL